MLMSLAEKNQSHSRHVPSGAGGFPKCTVRVSQGFPSQGKPKGVLRPARNQKLAWDRLMRTCAEPRITMTTPTPTKEAPGSARGQECHDKNRQTGCGLSRLAWQFLWEGTALKFGHFTV